jgi:glycosidase
VWENAVDKVAYGKRRSYFRGKQLDSVMNYPLRVSLIDYATNRNCAFLANTLTELYSSYPPQVSNVLMNIVGTHDTERILSLLGNREAVEIARCEQDNEKLSAMRLSDADREWGKKLLSVVSAIQYTVFGFPCVYYGDELGMEGMGDPFCRRPMAWNTGDEELLSHYRALGEMRKGESIFDGGDFRITRAEGGYFEFVRSKGARKVKVAANLSYEPKICQMEGNWKDIYKGERGRGDVLLGVGDFCVLSYRGQ